MESWLASPNPNAGDVSVCFRPNGSLYFRTTQLGNYCEFSPAGVIQLIDAIQRMLRQEIESAVIDGKNVFFQSNALNIQGAVMKIQNSPDGLRDYSQFFQIVVAARDCDRLIDFLQSREAAN